VSSGVGLVVWGVVSVGLTPLQGSTAAGVCVDQWSFVFGGGGLVVSDAGGACVWGGINAGRTPPSMHACCRWGFER
jgi:hypothetical protein